jgi:uncharacterized protein YjbI with pentapeptide repeats
VVVVAALVLSWLLFVPAADWLAHHDVGAVKGALHETALDNARARLLTLGAGLFAAGALWFTGRNFTLSREAFRLTEQGQVTDRYTKAIEQLGSDKVDVRIGGIYALERVAFDSLRDHPTVMEVLCAFVREHSREQWPLAEPVAESPLRATRPDVQAALTVVGRRDLERDAGRVDLSGADLTSADLHRAELAGAILARTILTGANLNAANLADAFLDGANLSSARGIDARFTRADLSRATLADGFLVNADFTGANLFRADLARAVLNTALLPGANLFGADLTGAELTGADLTGAHLISANLTGTILGLANLTGARIVPDRPSEDFIQARLTDADLRQARWPEDQPVPVGWRLGDRGLERTDLTTTDEGAN